MASRVLEIAADCPNEPAHRELWELQIKERLSRARGIEAVQLRNCDHNARPVLELNYDPRLITLGNLEREVRDVGTSLSPYRAELVLPVAGMVSPRSEQAIEAMLAKL